MCDSCEQGALAGQGMKKSFLFVLSPVRGAHPPPGTGRSVTVTELRALQAWACAMAWTQQRCRSTPGDTKGFPGLPLPRQDPWPSAALGLQRGSAPASLHREGSVSLVSLTHCQTHPPGSLCNRHCQQGEVGTPVPLLADLCGCNPQKIPIFFFF